MLLISIRDDSERHFYEIESVQNGWSIPELKRQIGSALYERLALSRDKEKVRALAEIRHAISQPSDVIKDPYVP